MKKLDPDKPIFNTRDIADILGVTTNFVREQVRSKALHATVNKPGARTLLRFSLNDVLAYDRDAAARLQKTPAA